MQKERLKTFKAEYTKDVGIRLLAFARRRLAERNLSRCDTGPSDLVNQAIAKFLDGTRRWNEGVDFVDFLYGIIRSDVSTLCTSKDNQRSSHVPEELLESERFTQPQNSALDKVMYIENRAQVLDHLRGERELQELACVIIDRGYDKPREIAECLQVPIDDVRNRLKRLRRRMEGYRRENRSTANEERVFENA